MPRSNPPGPKCGLLGLQLLGRIKRDMLGFYADMHRQYGDVVYMRFGPVRDFTVFHPDQIRELLVEKHKHFIRMPRPIKVLAQWNGEGLLITEGETWLRHRRIIQPAFSQKRFAAYADSIVAAARGVLERLTREPGDVDFEAAMTDVTTAAICRTMFGTDLGDERAEVRRAVQVLSQVAINEMFSPVTLPDWLPLAAKREKKWAMAKLDATVRRFIRERRASGDDKGDLLSMLLLAVDEEGDKRGLTDEQVRDQSVSIFLAGHDTTAAALTWVGWALVSHPEVQQRAAAEARDVLGDRDPTFADLPRLSYVERVVKETLRHWPPAVAVFGRQALDEVEIGGYRIPKGTVVRPLLYVTHHDERWFPDPERFDPDRFAPGRIEQIRSGAYVPFGAGPRACIGNTFAMMEMTLVTAMLVRRFTLLPAPAQREPGLNPSMSLRPIGGMRLAMSLRNDDGGLAVGQPLQAHAP